MGQIPLEGGYWSVWAGGLVGQGVVLWLLMMLYMKMSMETITVSKQMMKATHNSTKQQTLSNNAFHAPPPHQPPWKQIPNPHSNRHQPSLSSKDGWEITYSYAMERLCWGVMLPCFLSRMHYWCWGWVCILVLCCLV